MPASNTPSHVPDRHHPILVTDGQQVLSVSIHAGMSTDLISRSIIEGFDLGGHEVLGLRAPAEGTIFPLSLVARAPSFFSRAATREPTTFGLVLEAPAAAAAAAATAAATAAQSPRARGSELRVFNVDELLGILREAAPNGLLERTAFSRCFQQRIAPAIEPAPRRPAVAAPRPLRRRRGSRARPGR